MGGLAQMKLSDFLEAVAAKTPTPGGGSVSAAASAMGAALGIMAARFSEGDAAREGAARLEELQQLLTALVDADAEAYDLVHAARGLPKGTPEEKERRTGAIQNALGEAAQVPLNGMKLSVQALEALHSVASRINPNLSSDLGTSALLLQAGLRGCELNVRINVESLKDRKRGRLLGKDAASLLKRGTSLGGQLLRGIAKSHGA